jgi:hypothetical protein
MLPPATQQALQPAAPLLRLLLHLLASSTKAREAPWSQLARQQHLRLRLLLLPKGWRRLVRPCREFDPGLTRLAALLAVGVQPEVAGEQGLGT